MAPLLRWIVLHILPMTLFILVCGQDTNDQLFSTQFTGEILDLSARRNPRSRVLDLNWSDVPIDNPFSNGESLDMTWKKLFGDRVYEDYYLPSADQFMPRWTIINIELPPDFGEGRAIFSPLMRRLQRFKGGVVRAVKPQTPRSASRTQFKLQKLVSGTCC
eukprot:GDKJ01054602.1.p1 GENE.GDKJ01054602.1~~GDKJ01054602.1.p1  ORF type:complete len:161 (-),score=16.27 GDKJ01054602.1:124-606(-)